MPSLTMLVLLAAVVFSTAAGVIVSMRLNLLCTSALRIERARADRWREAFSLYGGHGTMCPYALTYGTMGCDCGYDAARTVAAAELHDRHLPSPTVLRSRWYNALPPLASHVL